MSKMTLDSEKRISHDFQKRITELIDEQDCSLQEFALLTNVNKGVIHHAVAFGIIPSLKILIRIADYLDVSLPYLLGETDNIEFFKSDNPSTFHERIELLKTERKVTYGKISQMMPFSRNCFYEWQRVKTLPTREYLDAIAEYFKVSVDYLLGRTDYRD